MHIYIYVSLSVYSYSIVRDREYRLEQLKKHALKLLSDARHMVKKN